jgi:hypothetical protein
MTRAMWYLGYHRDALALVDCARSFLESYARSKGKRFWIEKIPASVDLLPELREAMPDRATYPAFVANQHRKMPAFQRTHADLRSARRDNNG